MDTKITFDMNAPATQRVHIIKNETGSLMISVYKDGEKLQMKAGGGSYNCMMYKGTQPMLTSKVVDGSVGFWKEGLTGGDYIIRILNSSAKELCRFKLFVDLIDEDTYEGASDFRSFFSQDARIGTLSCDKIDAAVGVGANLSVAGIWTPVEAGGLHVDRTKKKTVGGLKVNTTINAVGVQNKILMPLSGMYLHEDYTWDTQDLNQMKHLELTPITIDGNTISVLAVV